MGDPFGAGVAIDMLVPSLTKVRLKPCSDS